MTPLQSSQEIARLQGELQLTRDLRWHDGDTIRALMAKLDQHAEKVRQMREAIIALDGHKDSNGYGRGKHDCLQIIDSHFPPTAEPSGDSQGGGSKEQPK